MEKPAEIFLSYKAEDRPRLSRLAAALEKSGHSLWWDAHIGGGSNWREDIQRHLEQARCVIVAWSKKSVGPDGNFVRDEASRAQRRQTYLPILLDPVEPPLGFGEVQSLDMVGWRGKIDDPRFTALLSAIEQRVGAPQAAAAEKTEDSRPRISRRAVMAAGAVGGLALLAGGGAYFLRQSKSASKRIAVLPFANLSGDPQQAYFSAGIAEELRSALSRTGLQVIGRASSEAVSDMDTVAAAKKLDVGNVLTGSIRKSADFIRISAQLIDGKDGVERWSQSYDRSPGDAIEIQTDIAAQVVKALSIALGQAGRAAIALGGTADAIAYDFYLKGRELLSHSDRLDDIRSALRLFDNALARDSDYVEALLGRASALLFLTGYAATNSAEYESQLADVKATLDRAAARAPTLPTVDAVFGAYRSIRLEFRAAVAAWRNAISKSADDPYCLGLIAEDYYHLVPANEALALSNRVISLDPLNATGFYNRAGVHLINRQPDAAIVDARRALSLAPDLERSHGLIAGAWFQKGDLGQARKALLPLDKDDYMNVVLGGIFDAREGKRDKAQAVIDRITDRFGDLISYQVAEISAQMGKADEAFAALDRAIAVRDAGLDFLKADFYLDPLRDDPRFDALVRKLDFP